MKEKILAHKNIIITACVIVVILAAAFFFGGNAPGTKAVGGNMQEGVLQVSQKAQNVIDEDNKAAQLAAAQAAEQEAAKQAEEQNQEMEINPETGKDKYQTDPVPAGKPAPVEPEDTTITSVTHTCTISVSCATILNNMEYLNEDKVELIPEDGWILKATQVSFNEGESVYDVLQRVLKSKGIHMEVSFTPIYNSAYLEGINNIYEFDCGELSGWMYSVNDWYPNYGCSRYQLKAGDVVKVVYTCDLGYDVGGGYASQSQ